MEEICGLFGMFDVDRQFGRCLESHCTDTVLNWNWHIQMPKSHG